MLMSSHMGEDTRGDWAVRLRAPLRRDVVKAERRPSREKPAAADASPVGLWGLGAVQRSIFLLSCLAVSEYQGQAGRPVRCIRRPLRSGRQAAGKKNQAISK